MKTDFTTADGGRTKQETTQSSNGDTVSKYEKTDVNGNVIEKGEYTGRGDGVLDILDPREAELPRNTSSGKPYEFEYKPDGGGIDSSRQEKDIPSSQQPDYQAEKPKSNSKPDPIKSSQPNKNESQEQPNSDHKQEKPRVEHDENPGDEKHPPPPPEHVPENGKQENNILDVTILALQGIDIFNHFQPKYTSSRTLRLLKKIGPLGLAFETHRTESGDIDFDGIRRAREQHRKLFPPFEITVKRFLPKRTPITKEKMAQNKKNHEERLLKERREKITNELFRNMNEKEKEQLIEAIRNSPEL